MNHSRPGSRAIRQGLALALLLTLPAAGCDQSSSGPAAAAVKERVEQYFISWSAGDMAGYQSMFHPAAYIAFVDANGRIHPSLLPTFIKSQGEVFQDKSVVIREDPTDIDIDVRGRVAFAVVRWKLQKGSMVKTGTDYMTWLQAGGEWRILNLTFEQDP